VITLSGGINLLFKLHGNRSNLIVFKSNVAVALFRNHQAADLSISLDQLDKEIDWSEGAFHLHIDTLPQHYFTFGKVVWRFLNEQGFQTLPPAKKWQLFQELLVQLENPVYYITRLDTQLILSLVPVGENQATYSNSIQALNEFFTQHSIQSGLSDEKQTALSRIRTLLKNSEAYLKKTSLKLVEIEADDQYKKWADLLMANMHQIKAGMDTVRLPDFYLNNQEVVIKLKKDLSAQKNAEIYYRKSKNHHLEVDKLKEALARKRKEIETHHVNLTALTEVTDLKTLRALIARFGLEKTTAKKEVILPYHEMEYKGYAIWVGKHAKGNDELTQKYTHKDDLWLHAKDVPGSHVVIKYQSGKSFPKDVIEKAAQFAAYNSKRKNDTLCPVVYTSKKYVRKRKGDPPGTVIVEREEVILVEPAKF
jgi:predicted ribosome quality control (RQC) complex YloA/Tae2 family protein